MVSVGVFEFSGMRCQPLRRALAVFRNTPNPREGKCTN
ncbi:TPA: acetyltransferase [Vibrio cholerae]|nr:acetyltransferase [Vibrio cholerae]